MNTSGIPKKVTQQAQRSKEGFSTGCRRILTTLMECDRPVLIPADEAFPLARGWEKVRKTRYNPAGLDEGILELTGLLSSTRSGDA
jgi:hypothetical protein